MDIPYIFLIYSMYVYIYIYGHFSFVGVHRIRTKGELEETWTYRIAPGPDREVSVLMPELRN